MRVLVAGVGDLLHGDDGFGVEVARRLLVSPPRSAVAAVTVIETGIGGIHRVREFPTGYGAQVIVDAVVESCARHALPARTGAGRAVLLAPEVRWDFFADTHHAEPGHALALAGCSRATAWHASCFMSTG